tara:strand:- start:705 stop:1706 length:1002 start_codon:yes stop_codon:yes gene_type:complete
MILKKNLIKLVDNFSKLKIVERTLDLLNVKAVFLNYHRVIKDDDLKQVNRINDDLIVTSSVFDKQIRYLKENFKIVSINELNDFKHDANKKIVITFDDGYLDNFENALPILKKYNCPAIIYVSTSFLDNIETPWWLTISNLIASKNNIILNKKNYDISEKKNKSLIFDQLSKKFIFLKKKNIDIFIQEILHNNKFELTSKNDFLSTEKLIYLNSEKLIDIGCHTHHHQNLKILSNRELDDEVRKSLNILEKKLNSKIYHFSIPFGSKNTFSKNTFQRLSQFEFKTIVTTEHGIFRKENLLRIPRIGVGNYDNESRLYSKAIGLDSILNKLLLR